MRTIYSILLLGLLLIGYLFFKPAPPLEERPFVEEDFRQELTDMTFRLHTLDEEMVLELKSSRFVEHEPSAPSLIDQIEASLYEGERQLLTFFGDQGEVTSKRDQVVVGGPVLIEREDASFTSGYLLYDVDRGLLFGEEGVSYEDGILRITADRFTYDPKKRRIYLKDNARLLIKKEG